MVDTSFSVEEKVVSALVFSHKRKASVIQRKPLNTIGMRADKSLKKDLFLMIGYIANLKTGIVYAEEFQQQIDVPPRIITCNKVFVTS